MNNGTMNSLILVFLYQYVSILFLDVELLGHKLWVCTTLVDNIKQFPKVGSINLNLY